MQEDLFKQAVEAHLRGDLEKAIHLYRRTLDRRPDDWAALHNLGLILLSREEIEEAIGLLRKAVHLNPDYPDGLNTLATALKRVGDKDGAVRSLSRALDLRPDFVEARFNLANLYREMGAHEKAIDALNDVLAANPRDHDALNVLGSLLSSVGRHEEGRTACLKSLEAQPAQAAAHYTLGMISMREGDTAAAALSFRSALRVDPASSDAHLNLGVLMAMEGKEGDAVACFKKAVAVNPRSADGFYNLGLAFERIGDLDEEIATQEAALNHCPDAVQSWIGAVRVFSKIADWGRVDPLMERIVRHPFSESEASLLSSVLFMLHSFPLPDRVVYEKHLLWGGHSQRAAARINGRRRFDFTPLIHEAEKIRVGYVSPDLCRHSVGWFFREIAIHHDPEICEIYCYAADRREDDLTEQIRGSVASFSNVHALSTRELASKIYRDRIHILVDLAGHTRGNRMDVFALKPAPVQVTMIGYPNTTGLRTMDYRITDHRAETPSSASCCLEKHVYLPEGFLPFYPVLRSADPPTREDLGLPPGKTILISLNRAGKLRPEVLRLWDRMIARCPDAVLALGCGHSRRDDLRENILSHFSSENRQRVFFLPRAKTEELHRARYSVAALALDPFPYAGTTTSYEALAMGVPVLTLVGDRHVQRTSFSMLSVLGVEETTAGCEEEYVDKAVLLIQNPGMLEPVRAKAKKAYMETVRRHAVDYVRDLEKAYLIMWERYLRGDLTTESIL